MRLTWACSEAAETAWPHTSNIFKFVVAKASTHSKLLAKLFCDAIRLQRPCTIILETSTNNTGWQVSGYPCKDGSYVLWRGWRSFCQLNNLKEDDTCTFHELRKRIPDDARSVVCSSRREFNGSRWNKKMEPWGQHT
ncbi:hypothetical protein EJB05_37140, partial [Eragrostis curvula]